MQAIPVQRRVQSPAYLVQVMGVQRHRLEDKWFVLIGMPLLSALYTTVVNLKAVLAEGRPWPKQYLTDFAFVVICWMIARELIRFARRRFPGHQQTFRRVALLFGITTIVALLEGLFVVSLLNYSRHYGVSFTTADLFYTGGLIFVFSVMIMSVYELIYSVKAWKELAVESEILKRENLVSQLESLKEQVKPHFLFNSLSTLVGLIDEDRARAKKFVEELAYVYRYLLQSNDKELISLDEELSFVRAYVFLLKTRFEDRLQVDVAVSESAAELLIPPLTLQVLLENAVKHNEVSTARPLHIRIADTGEGVLEVSNTLQRRKSAQPSTKKGLPHIFAKYALLQQPGPELYEANNRFIVQIPLITPPAA